MFFCLHLTVSFSGSQQIDCPFRIEKGSLYSLDQEMSHKEKSLNVKVEGEGVKNATGK